MVEILCCLQALWNAFGLILRLIQVFPFILLLWFPHLFI